nr:hypothetical protein [uncultured Allomuricauda sp.]
MKNIPFSMAFKSVQAIKKAKYLNIPLSIAFSLTLCCCSKDDLGLKYGDHYQGGIVFYILQ